MGSQYQARVFQFTKAGSPVVDSVQFVTLVSSSLSAVPDGATFITRRDAGVLQHLLVTDDLPTQEGVAFQLAQAMHAHVTELDETPDLGQADEIFQLKWTRRSMFGVSNMAGADVSTIAQMLGALLRDGEWVAMSVRTPTKFEAKWNSTWVRAQSGGLTHQSLQAHAKVVSMWAGGMSGRGEAIVTGLAGALPGFSIRADAKKVSAWKLLAPTLFTGIGTIVAGVGASKLPGMDFGWWPWAVAAGVAIFMLGVGGTGMIPGVTLPGRWKSVRRMLSWGRIPEPPTQIVKPKQPKAARTLPDGAAVQAVEGSYPLRSTAFLVSAHYPGLVVNPHAGVFSASSGATGDRPTPAQLTDPNVGIEVGENGGAPAYLSWHDMWSGTFLIGMPGSGKTALLEWMWGETCRAVAAGARITPVALDTKGDGMVTRQMAAWGAEHKVSVQEFHVADTTASVAIDMFPRIGSTSQQARRIVDAFVYLYGEQSVGLRSADTLARVFHAALIITPEMVVQSGAVELGVNPNGSPFHFANVLLGGLSDGAGKAIAEHIAIAAVDTGNPTLVEARAQLAPLYSSEVTPRKRQEYTEAPRNKVAALLTMEHWWSAPKTMSWSELLSAHQPVVVNTGVTPTGEQPSDQRITEEMGALLLHSLRLAISETCAGWQAQGRAVRIFADEVKAVAAASPEVVTWLRSDGRAYGAEAVFATQQPSQLPDEVRKATMSFGTLVAFMQNEELTAKEIAANLSLDGSAWDVQDVTMLPRYTAIVRATFQQERLSAFTVQVPNFRARRQVEATLPVQAEVAEPATGADTEQGPVDAWGQPIAAPESPSAPAPAVATPPAYADDQIVGW